MNKKYKVVFDKKYIKNRKTDDLRLINIIRNSENEGEKEAAREELILKYEQKVRSIAAKLYFPNSSISYDDLVQEGWRGVMRSIDKYDASKNVPFDFYTGQWVRAYAQKFIDDNETNIRIPVQAKSIGKKINKLIEELQNDIDDENEIIDEVALKLKIPEKKIRKIISNSITQTNETTVVNSDGDTTSIFNATSGNMKDPSELQQFQDDIYYTMEFINNELDDEEKFIITEYFGLNDKQPKTLDYIGTNLKNVISKKRTKMNVLIKRDKILNKLNTYLKSK